MLDQGEKGRGRSGRPSEVADRLGAKVVARPFGFVGSLEFGGFLQDVGLTCGQRLNPFPLGAECAATLAQVLPAFLEPVQEPRTKRLTL